MKTWMEKFLIFMTPVLFTACGEYKIVEVPVEVPGPETVVEVKQKWEGLYNFEETVTGATSGPLELLVGYDGAVDSTQSGNGSKLLSQNFNGGFGTHPLIRFTNVVPAGDTLTWSGDVTYTTNDDLEEDGTTTDLGAGAHFTVYTFTVVDGKLNLQITIYDGSTGSAGGVNEVVIERNFREI